ncbi:MAG: helix-turn-helix transcriptional regulator [Patulibacter sp.]|nr:helix-turn-helix transcriptional regulator [Patulibacter sp.]
MEPRQQFAANLLAARQRSGLTQEALGFAVGLHRTEVSLLERAGRDPRLETIAKLARGLEIPASDLLNGIE